MKKSFFPPSSIILTAAIMCSCFYQQSLSSENSNKGVRTYNETKTQELEKALLSGRPHSELRQLILEGADPRTGFETATCLMCATGDNDVELCKVAVENGADVNERFFANRTPIMNARSAAMINLLIKQGADIYATDDDNDTALHTAALNSHITTGETLSALCNAGCNPNAQNKSGYTPLHYLCLDKPSQFEAKFTALLLAGADNTLKNKKDETPRDIVKRESPEDIACFDDLVATASAVRAAHTMKEKSQEHKGNMINR